MNDFTANIPHAVLAFIPFLFALCVHEYAHGLVANKLGDPTAKLMGRLTLNPAAHADVLGTIVFPIVGMLSGFPMIGWAKPVPVNPRNLKNQKMGMFWVALAGPGSNVIMACLGAVAYELVIRFLFGTPYFAPMKELGVSFIYINLALAFFNLIPLNPLDGGKIFAIFFSESFNRKMDENQMVSGILIMVLFFSGFLGKVLFPVVDYSANFLDGIAHSIVGVI